jgi:general secretion pathway protein J
MTPRAPGAGARRRPRSAPAGFTLLELLVALSILALLSVLGYRALVALTDSETRLSAEAARWRALDTLFMRLEADLRQTQPRPARFGDTIEPPWVGTTDFDGNAVLRISRAGPEFALEPGSAGQRIGYRLNNGSLEVLYWPYLDVADGTEPTAYALVPGVRVFHVEYLDREGAWREQWPAPGEPALPRAVRVQLTLADGAAVERWMVLQ